MSGLIDRTPIQKNNHPIFLVDVDAFGQLRGSGGQDTPATPLLLFSDCFYACGLSNRLHWFLAISAITSVHDKTLHTALLVVWCLVAVVLVISVVLRVCRCNSLRLQ